MLEAYTRWFNWNWANTLSYRGYIKIRGPSYTVQAGYEAKRPGSIFQLQAQDFPLPITILTISIINCNTNHSSGTISEYTFLSYFALVILITRTGLLFQEVIRRDGSSRFGSNDRWGNFWSVGASWNVDKENFMESIEFIDQLKLRGSFGYNGNGGIGNYDWFPSYLLLPVIIIFREVFREMLATLIFHGK